MPLAAGMYNIPSYFPLSPPVLAPTGLWPSWFHPRMNKQRLHAPFCCFPIILFAVNLFCASIHSKQTRALSSHECSFSHTHSLLSAMVTIIWPPKPSDGLICQLRSYLICESHKLNAPTFRHFCTSASPSGACHPFFTFKLQHRGLGWGFGNILDENKKVNYGRGFQHSHKISPSRISRLV